MELSSPAAYRGRFAPSPTGPLHFGSLVAAAASYLDARAQGGEWLVRMEDVDTPRAQPGAAEGILSDLEYFGFQWDGPVMYQSQRTEAYQEAFDTLQAAGLVYPCGCTRKEIAEERYPGTCAQGLPPGKLPRSWRVRVNQELADTAGDFVLLRADRIFAYQLAVVVDDQAQGITDVVRGADLFDSTPRQVYLQQCLGYRTPRYFHIPVVLAADGQKLSKQNGAQGLDRARAGSLLHEAFAFLGLEPPAEMHTSNVAEAWAWGIENWDRRRVRTAV
ncbi:MAG: tRNA glutamyl-Q(34) synthetase GluQRS [Acidobacteriota bacterium]